MSDIEVSYPEFIGVMDLQKYVWAWSAVNTRCVFLEQPASEHVCQSEADHFALAPFLDMLNHSAQAQVKHMLVVGEIVCVVRFCTIGIS